VQWQLSKIVAVLAVHVWQDLCQSR